MEQVALAVDAGCRYIAPYVNELRVHFDTRLVTSEFLLIQLCKTAQYLSVEVYLRSAFVNMTG